MPNPKESQKIKSDNNPNPWIALLEYLKGLVTVSAALLAVSVTFSDKILSESITSKQIWVLRGSWLLLLFCIVAAILSTILTVNYLKNNTREYGAILFANTAFFLFICAVIFFFVVGLQRSELSPKRDIQAVINKAIVTTRLSSPSDISVYIRSVEWIESKKQYKTVLIAEPSLSKYEILLSPEGALVSTVTKIP
jgi:hypothetical protein